MILASYEFGPETRIDIHDNGLDTIFPLVGANLWAEPQDSESYREFARELGYGDNVLKMSQEHEVSHTLLARIMGLPYSPTLYGVAVNKFQPHYKHEEALVLAFQRNCLLRGIDILRDVVPWRATRKL